LNTNLCEIGFVLDRSGSMNAMKEEAIGGINAFLESLYLRAGARVVSHEAFNPFTQILADWSSPIYLPDYRQFHRQLRNGGRCMPGWLTASCAGKAGELGVGKQAN